MAGDRYQNDPRKMKASRDITDPTIISILAIRSIAVLLYNNYPHASSIRQIIMMIGPAIPAIFMIRFQFIVIMRYVFKLQNTKKTNARSVINKPSAAKISKKTSIMVAFKN